MGGCMATEYKKLNNNDTRELRKEIGLPITKGLIYWYKTEDHRWRHENVTNYEVLETYQPSESKSISITLEDGTRIRILGDYFADMQRSSFLNDIDELNEIRNKKYDKIGERVEKNVDSYVVVDLETTGTNHLEDEITEIGAIRYTDGKETDRFNVLVKTNVEIPKKVEKLTGISNDLLSMFGIDPQDACIKFRDFVGDSVIIGHNFTSFDSKFLDDAYVKELGCHFSNNWIDTLYLARKQFPDLEHHTLESLSEKYNIDYSKAHRAVEDCVINHLIYEYLTFKCLLCDESGNGYMISNPQCKDATNQNSEIDDEDELIEVTISEEWQKKIASELVKVEPELGLINDSLSIKANKGKNGKISSYAICVYEPDLVEDRRDSRRYTVLARIKEHVLKSNESMVDIYSKYFDDENAKKRMEKNSSEFINCIVECVKDGIKNYVPKSASFACCSRYQECSSAKECIHPNILYAKACQYRKNVDKGNIFY